MHRETNPRYHALLSAFKARTGCPVLVNTSFNVRGEPIVCTPEDAFRCFMATEMETLVVGNCLLRKQEQDRNLLGEIPELRRQVRARLVDARARDAGGPLDDPAGFMHPAQDLEQSLRDHVMGKRH